MTRTHRLLNRLVLALVGLGLLAVAGIAGLSLLPAERRPVTARRLSEAMDGTAALVTVLVVAVVLAIATVVWIVTRGRGRVRDVIGRGDLAVDDRVVEGLLRQALAEQSAVVGVHAHAFRHRHRVVYARVDVRRSTDLPVLLDDIERAAGETADRLGSRPPLVIHLTSGLVARASRTRIAR